MNCLRNAFAFVSLVSTHLLGSSAPALNEIIWFLNYIPEQCGEVEQAGEGQALPARRHHIYRGPFYKTTTQSYAFLFGLQLLTRWCRRTALLCWTGRCPCGSSGMPRLSLPSVNVPHASLDCRVGPGLACLPSGFHFSSAAATHVFGRIISAKRDVTQILVIESGIVSLLFYWCGSFIQLPLPSCCSFSFSC